MHTQWKMPNYEKNTCSFAQTNMGNANTTQQQPPAVGTQGNTKDAFQKYKKLNFTTLNKQQSKDAIGNICFTHNDMKLMQLLYNQCETETRPSMRYHETSVLSLAAELNMLYVENCVCLNEKQFGGTLHANKNSILPRVLHPFMGTHMDIKYKEGEVELERKGEAEIENVILRPSRWLKKAIVTQVHAKIVPSEAIVTLTLQPVSIPFQMNDKTITLKVDSVTAKVSGFKPVLFIDDILSDESTVTTTYAKGVLVVNNTEITVDVTFSGPSISICFEKVDQFDGINDLIVPNANWTAFASCVGTVSAAELKRWRIVVSVDEHGKTTCSTCGSVVAVPIPVSAGNNQPFNLVYIDNQSSITVEDESHALKLYLTGAQFAGEFNVSKKFVLGDQLFTKIGYNVQCNDFYKPMLSKEFASTIAGSLLPSNQLCVSQVQVCTAGLEAQRLFCYAFGSMWEVTVPLRNAMYIQTSKNTLSLDPAKMSYASWKFHWIFNSASTTILRTGSSSSTKVAATSNINLTVANVLQLAKRQAPASIGNDTLSTVLTSITLDVATMELEAKNAQVTLQWHNKDDYFALVMGTQVIVPTYDYHRRLMPQSPYADVLFELVE